MEADLVKIGNELRLHISQCYGGSEHFYRNKYTGFVNTGGVEQLAYIAKAHWLVSDVGGVVMTLFKPPIEFQIWELAVGDDHSATLTCRVDRDAPTIYRQTYSFTTFPLGDWKFYVVDGVMMLESEY